MRPYCASRMVTGTPRFAANQFSTRWDCAVTSGPMPSPPTTATLVMLVRLFMSFPCKMNPRALRPVSALESPDLLIAPERQLNLVEAREQSGAPARIDLEGVPFA